MKIHFSQLIPTELVPPFLIRWAEEAVVEATQLDQFDLEELLLFLPLLMKRNQTAVEQFLLQKVHDPTPFSPLWVPLATSIVALTEKDDLLRQMEPELKRIVAEWYTVAHDRDQNGIPEASGWNGELDRSYLEEPDLLSFLYLADQLLEESEMILGMGIDPIHGKRMNQLSNRLQEMWRPAARTFSAQMRGKNESPTAGRLFELEDEDGLSAVSLPIGLILEKENYFSINWNGKGDAPFPIEITVHGANSEGWGDYEVAQSEDICWEGGTGWWMGKQEWGWIERVSVRGMSKQVTHLFGQAPNINKPNLAYLWAPLWSGVVTKKQATFLWRRALHDPLRYWSRYGVRRTIRGDGANEIDLIENILLAAGLWRAGLEKEGMKLASLLAKLPHTDHSFFRRYSSESGEGIGRLLFDSG